MTALTPYLRAFAIELSEPDPEKVGHYRWPSYSNGKLAPKAYFQKFGRTPGRVIAADFLFCAKLFYPWDEVEGTVHEVIMRLEKLGWVPTLIEVVAATELPAYTKAVTT